MQYVVTETLDMAAFNCGLAASSLNWQPTLATSEAAAKRFAQTNRTFQQTIAHVAFITANSKIVPVAHRVNGVWVSAD